MKQVAEKKEKPDPPHEVVRERIAHMQANLTEAANAGDVRAQLRLGLLLYSGSTGVAIDREAARMWWQKAAAQGDATAAYFLEKCDFNSPAPPEPAETSAPAEQP